MILSDEIPDEASQTEAVLSGLQSNLISDEVEDNVILSQDSNREPLNLNGTASGAKQVNQSLTGNEDTRQIIRKAGGVPQAVHSSETYESQAQPLTQHLS